MILGLELTVIAEGVGNDSQLSELTQPGCLNAQDYLFAPAMNLAEITQLKGQ